MHWNRLLIIAVLSMLTLTGSVLHAADAPPNVVLSMYLWVTAEGGCSTFV